MPGDQSDPAFRSWRAAQGAAAVNSLDGLVRRIARRAAELTPEHRDQLAQVLAVPPLSSPPSGPGRAVA
jgi:hypothetical protein